ncbi:RNA polymerase sigma-70 factor [Paenibacillus oenotherae]|uniref:RNA polymerase sigma-70 factor n=1 Tax=Paenibacillus oenotherae TaxID=1435645 RepID=A0ABS7DBA1_9BACL|nr:RNA polymerase sigma-70 factor [Paenibacillus oenotherae]MBW7477215.1 RNA polymerase sigma-70 factor [Paenibacillus oenotherae]
MEQTSFSEQMYTTYKTLLFTLAYRMLGSVMDAEDIVQETFISLNGVEPERIDNIKSYLCRMVTNRCIDRLRSAQKQRETYIGPWLPEPLVTEQNDSSDPYRAYAQQESLSTAYLLLLQQLSAVERAVFLLREVLQYDYEEIAEIVGKSGTNCRQIFHRAKRRIGNQTLLQEGEESVLPPKMAAQDEGAAGTINQFIEALAIGDIGQILNLLSSEAILYSDGGGKVRAAINPILGADRVLRFLTGIRAKVTEGFSFKKTVVNGLPGIVTYVDGHIRSVYSFGQENNVVTAIYIVNNPDKLKNVH